MALAALLLPRDGWVGGFGILVNDEKEEF